MSIFEALEQRGTLALIRLTAAVMLFLVLHLARLPLVLLASVLEWSLRRIDRWAAGQASRPPPRRLNHFYPNREESVRVHA